jgi:hypothetical protein
MYQSFRRYLNYLYFRSSGKQPSHSSPWASQSAFPMLTFFIDSRIASPSVPSSPPPPSLTNMNTAVCQQLSNIK